MLSGANGLEGDQTWAGPSERAVELEKGRVCESDWKHPVLSCRQEPLHQPRPLGPCKGSAPNLAWRNAGENGEQKAQKT